MPFDPERYAAGLRRENAREAERIRKAARQARSEALRIAGAIGQADSEVRAVYLFGSLTGDGPRHLHFDIDLALEGGDVYAAEEIAETASFPVDIVSLKRLPEDTRERIRQSGEELYSKER